MDTTIFKEAIKQFYRDLYKVEYLSNFDLTYEWDGDLYRFLFHFKLNNVDKSITISAQFLTLEEFTNFVITELKQRRLPTVDYFNLVHAQEKVSA